MSRVVLQIASSDYPGIPREMQPLAEKFGGMYYMGTRGDNFLLTKQRSKAYTWATEQETWEWGNNEGKAFPFQSHVVDTL